LPFLMTGGGPSGATKLYSILAYERAIGSLQYGPGSAIALSVAPLMAILIALLAKFLRQDDMAVDPNKKRPVGASVSRFFSRIFSLFLDLLMLPFDLLLRGIEALSKMLRKAIKGSTTVPLLKLEGRERTNVGLRLLLLLPITAFVVFPFYWVFVTS